MNSLKTTVVCIVLIGVLYGVYQVINGPSLSDDEGDFILEPEIEIASGPGGEGGQVPTGGSSLSAGESSSQFGDYQPPSFEGPGIATPSAIDVGANGLSTTAPTQELGTPANAGGDFSSAPATLGNPNGPPSTDPPSLSVGSSIEVPQLGSGSRDSGSGTRNFEPPQGSSGLTPPFIPSANNNSNFTGNRSETDLPGHSAPMSTLPGELASTWPQVEEFVNLGDYKLALKTLSPFYHDVSISAAEKEKVSEWLTALALKVIYSGEHYLTEPHLVRADEQLEQIAFNNMISVELLRNINSGVLANSSYVQAGTPLKIVPGPFRAEVNLSSQKLTLFLGDLFAGEFDIRTGTEPAPFAGTFKTKESAVANSTYGNPSATSGSNSPYKIPFGENLSIDVGPASGFGNDNGGCIKLSPGDAKSLRDILTSNAEIKIIR